MEDMKGLKAAEHFYRKTAERALKKEFPDLFPRMTIGLAGEGSECFGFDDELSRDHDFGTALCIWLDDKDYLQFGSEVQVFYETLLKKQKIVPIQPGHHEAGDRTGVLCTGKWYQRYTGFSMGPGTAAEWERVPEIALATATNGVVFSGFDTAFSAVRERLLLFYPERVRIKMIAERAFTMGQAGQYNYPRCLKRADDVASYLALSAFIQAAISMVYLLNRRYMPYYKWAFRGMTDLTILQRVPGLLRELTASTTDFVQKNALVERICTLVLAELAREKLTFPGDSFLAAHQDAILSRIPD